jgi:hypothetical protein
VVINLGWENAIACYSSLPQLEHLPLELLAKKSSGDAFYEETKKQV